MASDLEMPSARASGFRVPHLRWCIAVMLFFAAVLNYIDRQALSILAPTIQKELSLSENDYASVANYFLLAYTLSLLISGRLVDKLGTRISMVLFVGWWSIANIFTAMASSFRSLAICRFALGLGEAGNWPASTKVVSEWFTAKERGIAAGFYTVGGSIGATIAPIMITTIALSYHWQAAFVITGLLGFLWIVPWLIIYRSSPQTHPWITESEQKLLAPVVPVGELAASGPTLTEGQRWKAVLAKREVWLLMLARFLTDATWFFYQFWFAKYLFSVRGLPQEKLGISWVIFLAADIGALGGGFVSAYLIRRGKSAPASRLWAMMLCAIVMPLSPLVFHSQSLWLCLLIAGLIVLAHLAWLVNLSAMIIDLLPKPILATAFGVIATGSALGAMLMNKVVAQLVTNYSYAHWFYIAGGLHVIAWTLLFVGGVHRPRPAASGLIASVNSENART